MKHTILVVISSFVLFAQTASAVVFDFTGTNTGVGSSKIWTSGGLTVTISAQFSLEPNGSTPFWYDTLAPGTGVYGGSTGLGVVAYSGDNNDLDGSTARESLIFTFTQSVRLTGIHLHGHSGPGTNDDYNLDVDGSTVIVDRPAYLESVDYTGSVFRIWADGSNDDFRVARLYVTAVPEPATAWLFVAGLLGLFGVNRLRCRIQS